MTNSSTAYDATRDTDTDNHRDAALRATRLLALVGGGALLVDTVTIAVLNRSFDPLDSVIFFTGFAGMLLTAAALGVYLSRGHTGLGRVGLAVGAFLATMVGLGAVSWIADTVGRHVFSPANVGLHGEWSFFSVGLCLLVIAAWAARRHSADLSR